MIEPLAQHVGRMRRAVHDDNSLARIDQSRDIVAQRLKPNTFSATNLDNDHALISSRAYPRRPSKWVQAVEAKPR
jgi:hypothetical protein